jgi:hypothetical protein
MPTPVRTPVSATLPASFTAWVIGSSPPLVCVCRAEGGGRRLVVPELAAEELDRARVPAEVDRLARWLGFAVADARACVLARRAVPPAAGCFFPPAPDEERLALR